MNTVTILIDGRKYPAEADEPVLKVARREGIDIPALCYHEGLAPYGACRLCMVEVVAGGRPGMTTSCTLAAKDGLAVKTDTPEILSVRRGLLELYLAEAPDSDYIRDLAASHGVDKCRFAAPRETAAGETEKCVLCGLCVRICNEAVGAGVINFIGRGSETRVNSPYLEPSDKCIGCTGCADVCPTGVIEIVDRDGVRTVETWSNTRVKLQKCSMCGAEFCPAPMLDDVYTGAGANLTEDLRNLCTKCRRRLKIRKFSHMTMR